jgi:hypothetical protein
MEPTLLLCTKYKEERWPKLNQVKSFSTSIFSQIRDNDSYDLRYFNIHKIHLVVVFF